MMAPMLFDPGFETMSLRTHASSVAPCRTVGSWLRGWTSRQEQAVRPCVRLHGYARVGAVIQCAF